MSNKYNFKTIPRVQDSNARISLIERKDQFYISFGADNNFPGKLIDLVNYSSIHGTCVNATVEAIIGNGLTSNKPETLDFANYENESWNSIYKKVAKDLKLFGGFALEIIWSKDRSKIAEVYQIDFSYVRAKEKNLRGKVPGYYIWDGWNETNSWINQSLEDIPYLPVYNTSTKYDEPSQIYVYYAYRPGMKYYPLPDYVGALKVIDLDTEVDNFHINNIKNGLAPSLAITTFTNANEEERSEIMRMLEEQYAGSSNAGTLMYMDVDDPKNAPQITPIQQNNSDGYYITINEMVSQKILTAHRITSPMLLGIKSQTGLGNNAEEIEVSWRLFLNAVILPYQQSLLAALEYILGFNYSIILRFWHRILSYLFCKVPHI
jgi:capsid portal protein